MLRVPPEFAAQLPADGSVRVLLLIAEDGDQEWARLTTEQFGQGYAEGDAIYDQLPAG
jgi:hypothetical protein